METLRPIGLAGLIREFGLDTDLPATTSDVGPVARRTIRDLEAVHETYPSNYACNTIPEHIRFSLRTEPLDLNAWQDVMAAVPPAILEEWIRSQPTGAYARRAWYLYEALTGKTLDLPDVEQAPYCLLADDTLQFTWLDADETLGVASRRHRVRNNLLGRIGYCPLVRHTPKLDQHRARNYASSIHALTERLSASPFPRLFERAAEFLYLSETKSTYAIEGEVPHAGRADRFVAALGEAGTVPVETERDLVELQRLIIQNPRFAADGWRTLQNWVGQTRPDYSENVRYVCPKPGADLAELMGGWSELVRRIHRSATVDPVILATCASFGFVYLHPFEDGNGRIHRFLIHHVLANRKYCPPGLIFPVSTPILRKRKEYDAVLESLGRRILRHMRWDLDSAQRMTVENDTIKHYRYPDLTRHAEFLFDCMAETLERDWPEQLRFLETFDGVARAVESVAEMPDAKARLLVKLLMQNNGKLSASKRGMFPFLTDSEVERIEAETASILNPAQAAAGALGAPPDR